MVIFGKFFCKIGFHSWSKSVRTSHAFTSSVYDVKKSCARCKKIKKWVEVKK